MMGFDIKFELVYVYVYVNRKKNLGFLTKCGFEIAKK